MIDFAYAQLGLRYNPFGELKHQQRIDSAVPRCDFARVVSFLDQPPAVRTAVQFAGPRGSGKSTHLLLPGSALPGFRYTCLRVGGLRAVHARDFLMIDEAQRRDGCNGDACFVRLIESCWGRIAVTPGNCSDSVSTRRPFRWVARRNWSG